MRIITFGVFDLFHFGHLNLFKNIKKKCGGGDLTVFVQESSAILKYKPDAQVLYSTEERVEIIKSLRIVDEVQVYTDVDAAVKEYDFDIFAKGPDQNSIGVQNAVKWCIENNKKIIEIPRTANISSSYLKKIIDDIK